MATSLAKKPATFMREHTQQVRDHLSATERLRDQYFAAIKRAEAQYFDGIKRITDAITETTNAAATTETTNATVDEAQHPSS
jgi:cation transport regulator ChaB